MMAAKRISFMLLTAAIAFVAAPALFASIPRTSEAQKTQGACRRHRVPHLHSASTPHRISLQFGVARWMCGTGIPAALGAGTSSASITVTAANPTIGLTPTNPVANVGSTTTEMITISAAQGSPTTITLTSSNPAVATVPATVIIPTGATSATFNITGVATGNTTITATLPAALGSGTSTAAATVIPAGANIPTMSTWSLILMGCFMSIAALFILNR